LAFTPHGVVQLRLPNISVIQEGTPMAALTNTSSATLGR
jgi:hypothetical protein